MAIKAWLLGGAVTDDHIAPEMRSCWERKDLLDVPLMIAYSDTPDSQTGVHIYANNIGCKIILVPYGEFESHKSMEEDYYSSGVEYTKAYALAVDSLGEYIDRPLSDLDWVMPVMEGPLDIQLNYSYISDVSKENKELVSLIDCSMIYSSVKMISTFVRKMCGKKSLTKYEQYQLAYYQSELQSIEKPECFLINKDEIDIVTKIYDVWGIAGAIDNATANTKQAIMLFSFLADYQSNYENELFSSFLTFFGIVVGFEAIYNIITVMTKGQNEIFDIVFSISIVLILLVYLVVFCRKLFCRRKERKEFSQKTAPAVKQKSTGTRDTQKIGK